MKGIDLSKNGIRIILIILFSGIAFALSSADRYLQIRWIGDLEAKETENASPAPAGKAAEVPAVEPLITPNPVPGTAPKIIKLLFAGDTHFVWGIADTQKRSGRLAPVSEIRDLFRSVDFRVLNMETTLTDKGTTVNSKPYVFRGDPENIKVLQDLGINVALLGNNHSMDLGPDGLLDSIHNLRQGGIISIGAGKNEEAALSPSYHDVNGMKIAMISASGVGTKESYATATTAGVAAISPKIFQAIRDAKKFSDNVIVNLHWGEEYKNTPLPSEVRLSHAMIDSGATAVVCHHPHVPQGIEVYRGGIILYSLGNFLFGSVNQFQTDNMIVVLSFRTDTKKIVKAHIVPVMGTYRNQGHIIHQLKGDDARKFWAEMFVQSYRLSPEIEKRLKLGDDGTGDVIIAQD